ncbi:MAG: TIGR03960 family B12-binding radical SAM protein [Planctomycetes bacterium]|nr:TIGR03960 family B12-binding radical SAM protein [Planctomycetota bacterium]
MTTTAPSHRVISPHPDADRVSDFLNTHLYEVQTPGQYIGGELNSVVKDLRAAGVSFCFAFPDVYKIGMSHLGLKIFYQQINALDDMYCDLAFAPWPDMEAKMREQALPLFALESRRFVRDFDVIGFSLQNETLFTNVLGMLDLAGLPLRAANRGPEHPLVIAGGPHAFSPEPMAPFIDVFVVGDGEEVVPRLLRIVRECRDAGVPRADLLRRLARDLPSIYVPALYDVEFKEDGTIARFVRLVEEAPRLVKNGVVLDLENAPFPTRPLVPNVEVVHDRVTLEIMRGCTWSCRFCQAGMIKRPNRLRSVEKLLAQAKESYANSGYDEIAPAALSAVDYPAIRELIQALNREFGERQVGVSLPSLRIEDGLHALPAIINHVRKAGLTLAPEAGSERLRHVIDKPISNEYFFNTVREAWRQGWRVIKLYFMIGHPTETDDDIDELAALVIRVADLRLEAGFRSPGRVNVTISTHVPKPHTPFQWEPIIRAERIRDIHARLRDRLRLRHVKLKMHHPEMSLLEALLCKGDRRVADLIEAAWKKGARFDAWDELFRWEAWTTAAREIGFDIDRVIHRRMAFDEALPWDLIDGGARKPFMKKEWKKAERAEVTDNCFEQSCNQCGVPPKLCKTEHNVPDHIPAPLRAMPAREVTAPVGT